MPKTVDSKSPNLIPRIVRVNTKFDIIGKVYKLKTYNLCFIPEKLKPHLA